MKERRAGWGRNRFCIVFSALSFLSLSTCFFCVVLLLHTCSHLLKGRSPSLNISREPFSVVSSPENDGGCL